MDGKTLARIGAVVFVVVAIMATAIEMNRKPDTSDMRPTVERTTPDRDPLDAELARCSGIGEAGGRDPSCLKAWGQARRRFLRQPEPMTSPASSAPTTLFPGAPASSDPAVPASQPEAAAPAAPAQSGAH